MKIFNIKRNKLKLNKLNKLIRKYLLRLEKLYKEIEKEYSFVDHDSIDSVYINMNNKYFLLEDRVERLLTDRLLNHRKFFNKGKNNAKK